MTRALLTLILIPAVALTVACGDSTNTPDPSDATLGTDGTPTNPNPQTDAVGTDVVVPQDTTPAAQDTSPAAQDTAKPETVQPKQGLICPAILSCVEAGSQQCACADGDTDCQQKQQQCLQGKLTECSGQAQSPSESQLFGAFFNCQIECAQLGGGQITKGVMECIEDKCMDEQAACYSGGVYGAGACASVDGCAKTCSPLDASGQCLRDCMQAGTKEAVEAWWGVQICAQVACFEFLNTPNFNTCATESLQTGGACNAPATACLTP